jgi:hypothetical protein
MNSPLAAHAPLSDRIAEARRMAREGYGAEDLVITCHLALDTAKQLVLEAEYRRLARTNEAKP